MKIKILIAIQMAFALSINAQNHLISHFQSNYDTLENYNSATIESALSGNSAYFWEKTFDFGFDFPYHGETYTEVIIDDNGYGYFPESPNYNLYMFGGDYRVGNIIDTAYLFSEVRYKTSTVDGLKTLALEYHNVYVNDELDENGANHFINFQIWFYENGIIELHFGDIDLTQCSYYFPGLGFSFDNQDPTDEIYGPWLTINNNDYSEGACFFGNHNNPEITYDDEENCGILTSIPPEGYVVRFSPSTISSTDDIENKSTCRFDVTQLNDGMIKILDEDNSYKSCVIYDLMGRKIGDSNRKEFRTDIYNNSILILLIEGECGFEVHKLMIGNEN